MDWPTQFNAKMKNSEDTIIGKYEIFIDLKKTGQKDQENTSINLKKKKPKLTTGNPFKNSEIPSANELITAQNSDLFSYFTEDDCDLTQKYFNSNLTDLTNFYEINPKPLAADELFPGDLILDESSVEKSNDRNENINPNSTAHYIKFLNRNGKLVKVWECGICTRNFQHQYTLLRHLPTHTNVRNFVCNECGKAFRQLSTLSQHKAIHSTERPYNCETCNKSFNRISTLISHRKTHSDVKPFQCHMCNKGFHQKGNLRNHIYIHTNERPYRCSFCNKGFNQMSNLVCHTQKTHSTEIGSVWSCHQCNKSFPKRSLLRHHELNSHRSQSVSSRGTDLKMMPSSWKNSSSGGFSDSGPTLQSNSTTSSNRTSSSTSSNSSSNSNISTVTQSQVSENGILIQAIETDAMKTAKSNNEIPFAVLHFLEGLPLLVRIIDCGVQSLLRPANKEDFATLKKQQKNPQDKISVPVVAAVYQTVNTFGRSEFKIMSPKNIYKFSNAQQILSTNNMDSNDITPSVPTTIKNISNNNNDTIIGAATGSNDIDLMVGTTNRRMEISQSSCENLDQSDVKSIISDDVDIFLNDIVEISPHSKSSSIKTEQSDNSDLFLNDIMEISSTTKSSSPVKKSPNAIAIVDDSNNWLKENKSEEYPDEIEKFSETFQNIATGSLLTPKRINEATDINNATDISNGTDQNILNFDVNNFGFLQPPSSNTSAIENQFGYGDSDFFTNILNSFANDIDINTLRNIMYDQRLLSEIDNYFN